MNPWELVGWAIALPLVILSVLFVYAASVAVVRVIVKPRRSATTVSKARHLKVVE